MARYWWLIRPFVGHVLRATLRTVAGHAVAERAPGAPLPGAPSPRAGAHETDEQRG